jgi:Na+/proline symporter
MDWLFFLAVETLVSVMLILTAASVTLTYIWQTSGQLKGVGSKNLDMLFVTGCNVGNTWLVSWAIYSQMGGAWIVPTIGYFGYMFGLTGVVAASLGLGVQCMTVAVVSTAAYKNLPYTGSLPRSLLARFGRPLEIYILVVMLLTNLVCLISEYTALVGIFDEVLGADLATMLGIATVVSVYYVCFGGALIGLFTDQVHGVLGVVVVLGVLACVCSNAKGYSAPSRSVLLYGFDKRATQWFYLGTLFFNVTMSAFFEILWQKHTCCRVKQDLWKASALAAAGLALTAGVWGAAGMVAAWKDMAEETQFWGMSYVLHIDR